jgi:multidrug efflux pump subunit AcrB
MLYQFHDVDRARIPCRFSSVALAPLIPSGLIPAADTDSTTVNIELLPGSVLETTLQVTEAAQAAIRGVPGVRGVFVTVGEPQASGGGCQGGDQQAGEVRNADRSLWTRGLLGLFARRAEHAIGATRRAAARDPSRGA